MIWPWMSRRRFRREITAARRAYREERDAALRDAKAAVKHYEAQAAKHAMALKEIVNAHQQLDFARRELRITLVASDLIRHQQPVGSEYERLARLILDGLLDLRKFEPPGDPRGDLRESWEIDMETGKGLPNPANLEVRAGWLVDTQGASRWTP